MRNGPITINTFTLGSGKRMRTWLATFSFLLMAQSNGCRPSAPTSRPESARQSAAASTSQTNLATAERRLDKLQDQRGKELATPTSKPESSRQSAAASTSQANLATAESWLGALRDHRGHELLRLTSLPFEVEGIDVGNGLERTQCLKYGNEDRERKLKLSAQDRPSLVSVLECIKLALYIDGYLPTYPSGKWPLTLPNGKGRVGALRCVRPEEVDKRLGRYHEKIKGLSGGCELVELHLDDNNGLSSFALIQIKQTTGTLQVSSFLVDHAFEH